MPRKGVILDHGAPFTPVMCCLVQVEEVKEANAAAREWRNLLKDVGAGGAKVRACSLGRGVMAKA